MMSQRATVYVTSDGQRWLKIAHPDGLVPPPTLDLHQPMEEPVTFYRAQCYSLPIPPEALE
jgi:hypothetical protein